MSTPLGQLPEPTTDFLGLLTPEARERLLTGSMTIDFPAGSNFYRPGDGERPTIVSRGLVRLYYQDREGRQATVLFASEGALLGAVNMFGLLPNLFAQAVADTSTIALNPRVVNKQVVEDLATTRAFATYISRRLRKTYELVALRTLGSIRERLAYDLLERSSKAQLATGRLEIAVGQAELAESIGSSREVASRALAVLKSEGIVATGRKVIRVLDPKALDDIVRDFSV